MVISTAEPHLQMLLFHAGICLAVWREEQVAGHPETGQVAPLPESALDACGWQFLQEAEVAACFLPDRIPPHVREALGEDPSAHCTLVLELTAVEPERAEDGMVLAGTFDERSARMVLERLEHDGLSFEIELDHDAMTRSSRADTMFLIPTAPSPCVRVWVPVEVFAHAQRIIRWALPPETAPRRTSRAVRPEGPVPAPSPSMEIYASPSADLQSGAGRGQFLE
jgi:hypothetical protein